MGEDTELIHSVENERSHSPIEVIIQRHGQTDRTRPKAEDPQEVHDKAGWLTEEGVKETAKIAEEKAREILSEYDKATFFFMHSPSAWFSQGRPYGRRAEQTAMVDAGAVAKVAEEMELSPDDVKLHVFGKSVEETTRPHNNLAEPNLYFVEGAADPAAYHNALIEKYGRENWEEGFHQMTQDLEGIRTQTGAQSSAELAQDGMRLMRVINRYGSFYQRTHPDEHLVFWLTTHGDRLRSLVQYGLGVGDNAQGYAFKTGELVDLAIDGGTITTQFQNQTYERNLDD